MENSEVEKPKTGSFKRDIATRPRIPAPVRQSTCRRITVTDVSQVAELCAERLNEKEACAYLKINYPSWLNWKSRQKNRDKFDDALTALSAAKMDGHIRNIRSFEPLDWRASAHLLKIKDQSRFGDRPAEVSVTVAPTYETNLMLKMIRRVYSELEESKSAAIDATPAPLQLADAPTSPAQTNPL